MNFDPCRFNTCRFISEVQSRPVLWDMDREEFSNKDLKQKAWEDVAAVLYKDYDLKDEKEKDEIYSSLLRRWKSLRDCYQREINYRMNKKQNPSKSSKVKKQYIYYNQLSFMRPFVGITKKLRRHCEGLEESGNSEGETSNIDNDDSDLVDISCGEPLIKLETFETPVDVRPAIKTRRRNREALMATEINVLEDMPEKPVNEHTLKEDRESEPDPDKLFLLSLLPDLKKVHEDDRLDMKVELMNVVGKWKRARQSRH